ARSVDVHVRRRSDDSLSTIELAECPRRRSVGLAGSQSKRDLRSVVSTDVSVGARDRCDRMAIAVEHVGNWRMVSEGLDALPASVLAWIQIYLRAAVLEREKVDTGTRALNAQIPPVQSARSSLAGALLRPGGVALHVWRCRGVRKCATDAAAADDRLLSPNLISVACAEHRCELFTSGAGCSFAARSTDRAGSAIQTRRRDQLANGAQRRSILKVRLGHIQVAGVFRLGRGDLRCLLLAFARSDHRVIALAPDGVAS